MGFFGVMKRGVGKASTGEGSVDQWFESLVLIERECARVEGDLARAKEGISARSALLVSASAISFGVLAQSVLNEWSMVALILSVAAGVCGVRALAPSKRANISVRKLREGLSARKEGGHTVPRAEVLSGILQKREEYNAEEAKFLADRAGLVKYGFYFLVGSSAVSVFSILIHLTRGGDLDGLW